MKKVFVSSFAFALMAASAAAQGWVAELDAREVTTILSAAGGDIVLVGIDQPGTPVVVSSVRRFNAAGTPISAFEISGPGSSYTVAYDAVMTESGEVVVCGSVCAEGAAACFPWVSAWDLETGAKLWETTPALDYAQFNSITRVQGGYVAVGVSGVAFPSQAYAAGVDNAGGIQWQRTYDPVVVGELQDVTSTHDGAAVMTGYLDGVRAVIRVDANGFPVWARKIDLPGMSDLSVTTAADGSLFVTTLSAHVIDPWIARMSANGDVLWQKEFNTTAGVLPLSIEAAPDGGAFVFSEHLDQPTVMRIDAAGAVFWHRKIGLSDDHLRGGVLPTPEGGCFIAWSQWDFGFVRDWLARFGAYGGWAGSCTGTVTNVWTIASNSARPVSEEFVLTGLASGETTVPGVTSSPTATFASLVCGDLCTNPPQFCSSLPNSASSGSSIGSSGTTSVFANNLVLEATGLPVGTFGIFFYGTEPRSFPFGEGIVCIGGSTFRLPIVQSNAMGVSQHALDLNAPPSPAGQITPGSTFYFQHWYRDIAGGPAGFNFSNGLAATFCP